MPEQINSSFDAEGFQVHWDSTSLGTATECLQKYKYTMLDGWQPARKSVHLKFGGHYATALENYFVKTVREGKQPEDALLEVIHETLIDTWNYQEDDDGNRIPDTGAPWISDHNTKTRETLIRSIVWYFEHFKNDSLPVVELPNGEPAVEYSFALDLGSGYVWNGHMDRVVSYADEMYIMDQKTTGTTLSPNYYDQFKIDTQMSGYTFAGKAIYNIPIKGVIIDAAQIAVGFTRYARGFTFRTDDQLEEWYDEAHYYMDRANEAIRTDFFPKNDKACDRYGGCIFRNICGRSASHRDNFLRADFTRRAPWNPADKRRGI